jgi:hypothetical protein
VTLAVLDAEPPCRGVAERLAEVHAAIDEGRISSIAVAVVYRDGSVGGSWSDASSRPLLIGALADTQFRLLSALNEVTA